MVYMFSFIIQVLILQHSDYKFLQNIILDSEFQDIVDVFNNLFWAITATGLIYISSKMVVDANICENYVGISHKIKFIFGISVIIPSFMYEFFLPESSDIQQVFKVFFFINTYIIAMSGNLCYNMVVTALNRKCYSLLSSNWRNDNENNYGNCLNAIHQYKILQISTDNYLFLTVIFNGLTFIFDTFYLLVAILESDDSLSTVFLIGYIIYDSVFLYCTTSLASEAYETMKNLETKLR